MCENRAALSSFCTLNEQVLSYYKSIWSGLQSLTGSSQIDAGVIDEIKPILVLLSNIKEKYETLKRNANVDCEEEILEFQNQIDSMTIFTADRVWDSLGLLEEKNATSKVTRAKKMREGASENKKTQRKRVWFYLAPGEPDKDKSDIQVFLTENV